MIMIKIYILLTHTAGCTDVYLATIFSPRISVLTDPWTCQPSPIRARLNVAKAVPSALTFFPPSSPLSGFCVGFHVSAALPRELPHYSQSGAH